MDALCKDGRQHLHYVIGIKGVDQKVSYGFLCGDVNAGDAESCPGPTQTRLMSFDAKSMQGALCYDYILPFVCSLVSMYKFQTVASFSC